MEIVHQLGELFLQAVPTVLIVFLFYLFLRANFFGPMEKILDERRERTIGAQRAAQASQAAAQEKERAYQDALRKARAEIYAEQESARQKVLEERNARLREGRGRAASEVQAAKERIARDMAAARSELEAASGQLGSEIVSRILKQSPPQPASPGRGTR
ncbi:MAG TPA: ATP synthase F0 subunit B [Candidatus Dormibacteraeota bacterium]|nr:ATP synthase F0 subunit B [Candidatus Dormibacteraeota bacterium]